MNNRSVSIYCSTELENYFVGIFSVNLALYFFVACSVTEFLRLSMQFWGITEGLIRPQLILEEQAFVLFWVRVVMN